MSYEIIKRNYDKGLWSEQMVHMALEKGVISQSEYDDIIQGIQND